MRVMQSLFGAFIVFNMELLLSKVPISSKYAKFALGGFLMGIVMVPICFAGRPVKSGLKLGEQVNAFLVEDVTGSSKGRTLCYRCGYGPAPVVCVFARKTTDSVTNLIQQIDRKVGEQARDRMGLKSFVVLIPAKGTQPKAELQKLAVDAQIKNVPLTISAGINGPPDYQISSEADITVLMWKLGDVKVNRAYQGDLTAQDVRDIVGDIATLMGNGETSR